MMRKFIGVDSPTTEVIDSPAVVKLKIPCDELTERSVVEYRGVVGDIVNRKDDRLLVVVAMQAVRDVEAVAVLSQALHTFQREASNLYVVLQAFCSVCDMYLSRELLREGNAFHVPMGMNIRSPYILTYTEDMLSWALADGEMLLEDEDGDSVYEGFASGLVMPFALEVKPWNLDVVVRGVQEARSPGWFIGSDQTGHIARHETRGNAYGHVMVPATTEMVTQLATADIPHLVRMDMQLSPGYAYLEMRKTFASIRSWRRESKRLVGTYLYSASPVVPIGTLGYLLRHLNEEMGK
ncbi:hypothetical protein BK004_04585 [bacterium CG10_46_32]|nr:MAG: hypothetical protein BK004_04585 [bacterium CG10_46_32]